MGSRVCAWKSMGGRWVGEIDRGGFWIPMDEAANNHSYLAQAYTPHLSHHRHAYTAEAPLTHSYLTHE